MTMEDWGDGQRRTFGMQIGNDAADGERFLLLFNAAPDLVEFRLPQDFPNGAWVQVFDTSLPEGLVRQSPVIVARGASFPLEGRTLVMFQHANGAKER
jgi:glycogen operon protein